VTSWAEEETVDNEIKDIETKQAKQKREHVQMGVQNTTEFAPFPFQYRDHHETEGSSVIRD